MQTHERFRPLTDEDRPVMPYTESDAVAFDPDVALALVAPGWGFLRNDQLRKLLAPYPMGRRDILALAVKRNRPDLANAVDDTLTTLFVRLKQE